MGKKLASYLVLLVAGALMIYSGARTFHLLSQTLPKGQEVLAFLALLAFDGGLVAWLAVFMFGAQGGAQRAIAMLMICVSLIGIVLGFGGDTLMTAADNGMIQDASIGMSALILTTLIIAANIAAVTFYHVLSPENQRRMAEESARSQIEDAALGSIKSQAQQLSQELAPIVAAAWVADMRAHYLAQLTPEAQSKALSAPKPAQLESAKPSKLDEIKSRLNVPAAGPQFVTMASDGVEVEERSNGNGHGPKVQAP
jgi:4-amino-4-deoxy-L-arabinose transferase-like glycosyltransferase